jgi:transaldolase
MNPLQDLHRLGQSVWLDDIRRRWIRDGTLARWIAEDGLAGVTSNPAIFEKAINAGDEYDAEIRTLANGGHSAGQIYERLILDDVRAAADLFKPVYEAACADGFVSLEVSPHLADDTVATVVEARRLWRTFGRPNAMIKVPGTTAGVPAIRQLLTEGINVNVTLLFGLARYREVVDAFLEGLEQRRAAGGSVAHVSSVASFFLSRIDSLVDARLDRLARPDAHHLRGSAAIAYARLAYSHYREWSASERWRRLSASGARPQRLLWASTSTKDPAYADTKYVEALVGPGTVTTLPLATLEAYRDHGHPAIRLEQDIDVARSTVQGLRDLGIDLEAASQQLEREGVQKFIEPFDKLHRTLEQQSRHEESTESTRKPRTPFSLS